MYASLRMNHVTLASTSWWNIIYPLQRYPDVPDVRLSAAVADHA